MGEKKRKASPSTFGMIEVRGVGRHHELARLTLRWRRSHGWLQDDSARTSEPKNELGPACDGTVSRVCREYYEQPFPCCFVGIFFGGETFT